MTIVFHKGRYGIRLATSEADLAACQALRHRCFFGTEGCDADRFDDACSHVMIAGDAGLVGTFRLLLVPDGQHLAQTYAAQSYDLARLEAFPGPMVEMGRFCIESSSQDGDVLRLAWGALTQFVDDHKVALLFGCSSFEGTTPTEYDAAFGQLAARHMAPEKWAPAQKARDVVPLSPVLQPGAAQQMPPLLRTYLMMGGWVSDHAVIDHQMNTMHVFTGLEIAKVPQARAQALRAIAKASGVHI